MTLEMGMKSVFITEVSRDAIAEFVRLSGDDHPNHTDDAYMRQTAFGQVIAHGNLTLAYMTGASTRLLRESNSINGHTIVNYGYDRVRFLRPVLVGQTLTVTITVTGISVDGLISSNVAVTNEHGELVAVAIHLMKNLTPSSRQDGEGEI